MKLRLNLTPRITLVFVLFAAALLGGVGLLSYNSGRSTLQAAATSELLSTAIGKETSLNSWVDERLDDLATLSASPALVVDMARLALAPATPAGRAAHGRMIGEFRSSIGPKYLELFVLDARSGRILASTSARQEGRSKKDDPYFVNGKSGPFVKNPYYSATLKAPAMAISAPIRSAQGRLLGVLVARLDLKALDAIIQQRTGLRRSSDAFLVNPASQFVSQPRFISQPAVLNRTLRTEAVRRCLQRNSGVVTARDYRGTRAIVVYRWVPTRQLGLIVKMDEDEALAPARAFGQTIVLISGLALLLASVLASGLARSVTRPIRALQSGVARFGRGESNTRLLEGSSDEVGLLAREFNQMASAISQRQAQLREQAELLDLAQDAIMVRGLGGSISFWNNSARKMYGVSREEAVGRRSHELLCTVFPQPLPEIEAALQRDGSWAGELIHTTRAGATAVVHSQWVLKRGEAGRPDSVLEINSDISKRKQAEAEIRQLNEDLEARVVQRTAQLEAARQQVEQAARANSNMMEYSQDVICSIDEAGRFAEVSPACRSVWGYSPDDLKGRCYIEMVHPDDVAKTNETARRIVSGEAVQDFENRYLRQDGSTVDMLWSARWSVEEESMFCVARDITGRKQAEEELRAAKEAAEEASLAKSQFLANMSHEIRTPMNGVLGPIGLLLDSNLSGQQRELTEIARSSAESLLGIINDILDLSKIEVGKLDIEPIPFNLLLAVEETASMMTARAEEKGVDLIVRCPPEVPRHVIGDPGRIRQVLANLISNAIKFTPHGHVLIDIEAHSHSEEEVELRISVQDSGIGIAPDKIEHVFGRFNQADTSTTRRYGGTGLGLSISRQLVELMGGEIGATSTLGEGSTFFFTLRLPLQSDAPASSLPDADLSGVRVLIVDDNAVNRRVLHEQLGNWRLRNESCAGAEEALQVLGAAHAAGDPFQIAILDHQMPDMDGESLGRAIKADPRLRGTVLVMLTSLGQKGDALRLKAAGFAAYLLKPARQSELLGSLVNVWAARNAGPAGEMVTRHSIAEVSPAAEAKRRWDGTRVLVVEDNIVNQKVAGMILHSFGCRVEVAANGREALRSIEALPFDIIFMDCEMPEMDGFEATAEIRLRPDAKRSLPIVAVTARATRGDRERCLQSGMDDYMSKPVKSEDFQAALERWAPRDGTVTDEPGAQTHLLPPSVKVLLASAATAATRPALDAEVVARLRDLALATDASLLSQIFESFLSDGEARLGTLRGAIEKGDAVSLHKAAHALKGAGGNIGARGVADIAQELQALGDAGTVEGAEGWLGQLEAEFERVRIEIVAELEASAPASAPASRQAS